jgi:hypothetical protein
MEGSFFTESDLSEQDRHRLDCVTRFEGTLVEKAGLHPLALGPNRKLDRLVVLLCHKLGIGLMAAGTSLERSYEGAG